MSEEKFDVPAFLIALAYATGILALACVAALLIDPADPWSLVAGIFFGCTVQAMYKEFRR